MTTAGVLLSEYGGLTAENPQLAVKIEVSGFWLLYLWAPSPQGLPGTPFDALQEQRAAHAQLQKKLRTPQVHSGFNDSLECKSWNLLKGSYFPNLIGSLSDLRAQMLPLQEAVKEFVAQAHALLEMQTASKRQKSQKTVLSHTTLSNQVHGG